MAVGLPAAIAAKLVEPQTPVLCLTGDGGFIMRLGDLETAKREGLPIVVVIFNDGWLILNQAPAGPSLRPAPRHAV